MEKMQKLFLIVMNHEYPLQSFSVKIFNILKKIKISNLYLSGNFLSRNISSNFIYD